MSERRNKSRIPSDGEILAGSTPEARRLTAEFSEMIGKPPPNRPTLESLAALTVAEIAALPIGTLCDLQNELGEAKKALAALESKLFVAEDARWRDVMTTVLRASNKGTGTAHRQEGEHNVTFNLPKRDVWDQAKLRELWRQIEASGEDPLVYFKQELSVPSAVLANLPENVRAEFLPALTVKPGKPTYKITPVTEGGK